ncbi:MAG TPA: ABC transporter substrate-binding protein, partial [Chitinophagales bacterium]|nr:ABC transporter substrate-binding protein [Chitinophagales bacterium]
IRPEATWDNGAPITAADVIFTVKAVLNPKVTSESSRPSYDFIDEIVPDPSNPKKFTIYSDERYFLAEAMGLNYVLPEYIYDPNKLLTKVNIASLKDSTNNNPILKTFADVFNTKHDREKGTIVGSGPYEFVEWITDQRIELRRKKNWWGDKIKDAPQLTANPTVITYKIMTDWNAVISAMKGEAIDVAYGINIPDFVQLKHNDCFNKLFNLHTPIAMQYDYIGINTRNSKLSDKRTRRALAHLVNKPEIINSLLYGFGESVNGPIHPTKSYYNTNLKDIEFSIDKAKELLTEAGWKDSNGDGILDKDIDGVNTPFKITMKYNNGNERRKNYALLLQANAKKAGIEIEVLAREWSVYLKEVKRHDFDLCALGWVQDPTPDDLKQIWHTSSMVGDGSNYCGFGNAETDKIIEEIRTTLDNNKRKELYYKIQEIIYDEQPYIFLVSLKERIAIHKRFSNANSSVARPGFNVHGFSVGQAANAAQ